MKFDITDLYTKFAELVELHATVSQVVEEEEENATIQMMALDVILSKAIKQTCTALQVLNCSSCYKFEDQHINSNPHVFLLQMKFQMDISDPQLNCTSLSELRTQVVGLLIRKSAVSLLNKLNDYRPPFNYNPNSRCVWVESNLSGNSEESTDVASYIAHKNGC